MKDNFFKLPNSVEAKQILENDIEYCSKELKIVLTAIEATGLPPLNYQFTLKQILNELQVIENEKIRSSALNYEKFITDILSIYPNNQQCTFNFKINPNQSFIETQFFKEYEDKEQLILWLMAFFSNNWLRSLDLTNDLSNFLNNLPIIINVSLLLTKIDSAHSMNEWEQHIDAKLQIRFLSEDYYIYVITWSIIDILECINPEILKAYSPPNLIISEIMEIDELFLQSIKNDEILLSTIKQYDRELYFKLLFYFSNSDVHSLKILKEININFAHRKYLYEHWKSRSLSKLENIINFKKGSILQINTHSWIPQFCIYPKWLFDNFEQIQNLIIEYALFMDIDLILLQSLIIKIEWPKVLSLFLIIDYNWICNVVLQIVREDIVNQKISTTNSSNWISCMKKWITPEQFYSLLMKIWDMNMPLWRHFDVIELD